MQRQEPSADSEEVVTFKSMVVSASAVPEVAAALFVLFLALSAPTPDLAAGLAGIEAFPLPLLGGSAGGPMISIREKKYVRMVYFRYLYVRRSKPTFACN